MVSWNTKAFEERVARAAAAGIQRAAEVVADQMRRNFGTEGGGVRTPKGVVNVIPEKNKKPVRVRGRQRYVPAPPGAFPGVRLGHLRRSIAVGAIVVTPNSVYQPVGTNVKYGRYLEFGTSKMAARPWAMRSALMARDRAKAAFAAAVRRAL